MLNLLKIWYNKYEKDELSHRASAVAFHFTLSVFPILLTLFSLIPYFPIDDLDTIIMDNLRDLLPRGIYKDSKATIQDILSQPKSSVLSIGFLLTFYSSTSGMMELLLAFSQCSNEPIQRHFLVQRLLALALIILLGLSLLLTIVLVLVGSLLLEQVWENLYFLSGFDIYALKLWRYLLSFGVLFFSVYLVYAAGTKALRLKISQLPGVIFASLFLIVITKLFGLYLSNFASYNKLYGSIGTFLGFMLWLYLMCLGLLLGFSLNTSIQLWRKQEKLKAVDTPAERG